MCNCGRKSAAYRVRIGHRPKAPPLRGQPAPAAVAGVRQPLLPAVRCWSPQVSGQEEAVDPKWVQTVQVELGDSRSQVLAARQAGDEHVEQDLVGE
jgi:hypothetical protein